MGEPDVNVRALEAVTAAMARLEVALGNQNPAPPADRITRTQMMEIDPWDPEEFENIPIQGFLEIFDEVAHDLSQEMKVRLLRVKLKGSAKVFLQDHQHLTEGNQPYDAIRTALLHWYSREDPEKAAAHLWTMQKGEGETLRHFADRVRHTALRAVQVEGIVLTPVQTRTWVNTRSVKAFLKGLPSRYSSYFINNPPATLEAALKKAEELEEALSPDDFTPERWSVAGVRTEEGVRKCYSCGDINHFAANCPTRGGSGARFPTPGAVPRVAMGAPRRPCVHCGSWSHFPASCPRHLNQDMCDYCGYYGHVETSCQKRKNMSRQSSRNEAYSGQGESKKEPCEVPNLRFSPPTSCPPGETDKKPIVEGMCLPIVDSPSRKSLHVRVRIEGQERRLRLDTGAQISVLARPLPGIPVAPTQTLAWGADGQPLPFLGQQHVEVEVGHVRLRHSFRIFARDHSGVDLMGLDLLRRLPITIHPDRSEVIMVDPRTGGLEVINEVRHGLLQPERPLPMPLMPIRLEVPRSLSDQNHAAKSDLNEVEENEELHESTSEHCPLYDGSAEFPTGAFDTPQADLLSTLLPKMKHLPQNEAEKVTRVRKEFQELVVKPDRAGCTLNVAHRIETGDAEPVFRRPYSVPHALRPIVEQQLQEMFESQVIEPSSSPWGAPVAMVHKKTMEGQPPAYRFCCRTLRSLGKTYQVASRILQRPWEKRSRTASARQTPRNFEIGEREYLRHMWPPPGVFQKFWCPWIVPVSIAQRLSEVTCVITDVAGRPQVVHVSRRKPAHERGVPDDSFQSSLMEEGSGGSPVALENRPDMSGDEEDEGDETPTMLVTSAAPKPGSTLEMKNDETPTLPERPQEKDPIEKPYQLRPRNRVDYGKLHSGR
uniref:CCHC-type domain-containing protein n=1 Tax=Lygus hesperus TaxID=30085 RepID=A0A146LV18_LYGHE